MQIPSKFNASVRPFQGNSAWLDFHHHDTLKRRIAKSAHSTMNWVLYYRDAKVPFRMKRNRDVSWRQLDQTWALYNTSLRQRQCDDYYIYEDFGFEFDATRSRYDNVRHGSQRPSLNDTKPRTSTTILELKWHNNSSRASPLYSCRDTSIDRMTRGDLSKSRKFSPICSELAP